MRQETKTESKNNEKTKWNEIIRKISHRSFTSGRRTIASSKKHVWNNYEQGLGNRTEKNRILEPGPR